ncbi:hypothetical protein [Actinomadura sp. NEAU-AAG7]|uniref:hypothetical protein n=1 Tax=Actinomadura sp. NEAU-AAG7 TaxID=2839640 RepID=UPI001BE482D6|nr:hypothetical protein [Actinomadura sp. NEAU-AAG7]MBT2207023.1 hypothetical protein [Actinomadura sp. NEAU-AAG7]
MTKLFVVRWERADGRDIKHRFFSRRRDALAYASKLTRFGKAPEVFAAPIGEWQSIGPHRRVSPRSVARDARAR